MPSSTPRTLVLIAGKYSVVPISWTITTNGHGVIDSATVTLPTQGNPDWPSIVPAGTAIPIEIRAGFPQNPAPGAFSYAQLSQRFVGTMDSINPQWDSKTQTATFQCRSLGAILADSKTTTNLGATGSANLQGVTTTQYVQQVSQIYGLGSPVIQVQNPSNLQTVYATQQIVGVHNMRVWDILMACAETDGVYLWFQGNQVHYVDPALITRPIVVTHYDAGAVKPGEPGIIKFSGSHAPRFAKDILVEVRSYESKIRTAHRSRVRVTYDSSGNVSSTVTDSDSVTVTQQNFGNPGASMSQTSTSHGADGNTSVTTSSGSSSTIGGATSSGFLSTPQASSKERYVFKVHNKNQAECDALALQYWKQISSHEYRATFSIPMSPDILSNVGVTTKFRLRSLPWASFTQDYIPLRLTEAFDMQGWTAEVLGINHLAPQSGGNY